MKRLTWPAIAVLLVLGWAWSVWFLWPQPAPPPPAPLPADAIPVEPMKPEQPAPGQPRVVERVVLRTVEAPVPEATVRRLAEILARDLVAAGPGSTGSPLLDPDAPAPVPLPPPLERLDAYVSIAAAKLEGTARDGRLAWAWTGKGSCVVRTGNEDLPIVLDQPLSVSGSVALSSLMPEPTERRHTWIPRELRIGLGTEPSLLASATWYRKRGRVGYWAGASYAPNDAEPWNASGGLALGLGRR